MAAGLHGNRKMNILVISIKPECSGSGFMTIDAYLLQMCF